MPPKKTKTGAPARGAGRPPKDLPRKSARLTGTTPPAAPVGEGTPKQKQGEKNPIKLNIDKPSVTNNASAITALSSQMTLIQSSLKTLIDSQSDDSGSDHAKRSNRGRKRQHSNIEISHPVPRDEPLEIYEHVLASPTVISQERDVYTEHRPAPSRHRLFAQDPQYSSAQELPDPTPDLLGLIGKALNVDKKPKGGKYAHTFIFRGPRREATGMGELSIEEYLHGFFLLIRETKDPDALNMLSLHFEHILEDSKKYPWQNVRAWSEDVLFKIHTNSLKWSDQYKIDFLRSEDSHSGVKTHLAAPTPGTSSHSAPAGQSAFAIPTNLVKFKAGPPCRNYNKGQCGVQSHHVYNNHRQLHICAWCVTNKCIFAPHGEWECRSKSAGSQDQAGFQFPPNTSRPPPTYPK